ncbi:MAG: CHASE3 domain-containing protein [Candidatus Acidiferrum sp.]
MSSVQTPRRIFLLALALLLLSALSATWLMYRLFYMENLVRHTYDVLLLIDSVTSNLAKAGRYRMAYLENGNTSYVQEFEAARTEEHAELQKLRELILDNTKQLAACSRLEAAADARIAVLESSITAKKAGKSTPLEQAATTSEVVKASFEAASVADEMKDEEEGLLETRATLTKNLFLTMLVILLLVFSLSILLLFTYYQRLKKELKERSNAEANAQRLSVLVMTMQDEERRKFSRELHDSLGQNLTAAKILADQLIRKFPGEKGLQELQTIVSETLTETRTISHLLHPPLLDEMGFATAARWFIDGYAKRTGIQVRVDIPEEPKRLPRVLELTLFRVLQETLTNIHRHSKSKSAEVSYKVGNSEVALCICDFGIGISPEKLQAFNTDGSKVGIGLAGMRERVREQGGNLAVKSGPAGTTITAEFRLADQEQRENSEEPARSSPESLERV